MIKKIIGILLIVCAAIFYSTECICKEIFILSMATMGVSTENILIHNKVLVILSVVLFIIGIIMLILKDNNTH